MLNYRLSQKFKQLEYDKFNHLTTTVWLVYQRVKLHLEIGISLNSESEVVYLPFPHHNDKSNLTWRCIQSKHSRLDANRCHINKTNWLPLNMHEKKNPIKLKKRKQLANNKILKHFALLYLQWGKLFWSTIKPWSFLAHIILKANP